MSPRRFTDSEPEDEELAAIRNFLSHEVDEEFLRKYGAHSCGVGWKAAKDGTSRKRCIVLYVEQKRTGTNTGDIEKELPFVDSATGKQVTILTDVIQSKPASFDKGGTKTKSGTRAAATAEPVAGGVLLQTRGNPEGDHPGTLGGWAFDLSDDNVVLLSNYHILGDRANTPIHFPIVETDGVDNVIGWTKRAEIFSNRRAEVDCAIGSIGDPARAQLEVPKIGPAIMVTRSVRDGFRVEKYGGTTNHTTGIVKDPDWNGFVSVREGPISEFYFHSCFLVSSENDKPWAAQGDSGSLVFDSEEILDGSGLKPVVGLHFATFDRDGKSFGVACRIETVFKVLGLTTLAGGALRLVERQASGGSPAPNGNLAQLLDNLADAAVGTAAGPLLLEIVDRKRAELVTLILKNLPLRAAAADLLLTFVQGSATVDDILDRSVDRDRVADMLERFHKALGPQRTGIKGLVARLRKVVQQSAPLTTLPQVLAVAPEPTKPTGIKGLFAWLRKVVQQSAPVTTLRQILAVPPEPTKGDQPGAR